MFVCFSLSCTSVLRWVATFSVFCFVCFFLFSVLGSLPKARIDSNVFFFRSSFIVWLFFRCLLYFSVDGRGGLLLVLHHVLCATRRFSFNVMNQQSIISCTPSSSQASAAFVLLALLLLLLLLRLRVSRAYETAKNAQLITVLFRVRGGGERGGGVIVTRLARIDAPPLFFVIESSPYLTRLFLLLLLLLVVVNL